MRNSEAARGLSIVPCFRTDVLGFESKSSARCFSDEWAEGLRWKP